MQSPLSELRSYDNHPQESQRRTAPNLLTSLKARDTSQRRLIRPEPGLRRHPKRPNAKRKPLASLPRSTTDPPNLPRVPPPRPPIHPRHELPLHRRRSLSERATASPPRSSIAPTSALRETSNKMSMYVVGWGAAYHTQARSTSAPRPRGSPRGCFLSIFVAQSNPALELPSLAPDA